MNGNVIFNGEWDKKELFKTTSMQCGKEFWRGKKVLTIAANTSGLCLELARAGAEVTACEPDPYKNNRSIVKNLLDNLVAAEKLKVNFLDVDFFNTHRLANSKSLTDDTIIICYGLIYHFRDIIYAIEY